MNFGEALQVLDGLMLGDAALIRYKWKASFHMDMAKHTISIEDHLKYEQWIADNVFPALGVPTPDRCPRIATRSIKGEPYQYALLQTRLSPLLAAVYDRWYAGGEWTRSGTNWYIHGKTKVLPEWLMQTTKLPTSTLAHWFLNDGGSNQQLQRRKIPVLHVTFATNCFTVEEVYHLTAILNNMGIDTVRPEKHEQKTGSGLRIRLSTAGNNTNRFMDLVEPHIFSMFGDSEGPSYRDMIKRKTIFVLPPGSSGLYQEAAFDELRAVLERSSAKKE